MNGIIRGKASVKSPLVIFKDYNDIWAELSALYWSTTSSFLVSRHFLSSVEEIISHYCPQCMTRYMEDESHMYTNRCPSCFQCPECESVLVLSSQHSSSLISSQQSTDEKQPLELVCRYCHWKSTLTGMEKSDFELAVMENERQNITIDIFKSTLEMHEKNQLQTNMKLNQNSGIHYDQNSSEHQRLPHRVCLRTKRTVRCRHDFEQGKMSILVQPKVLPLEGDSSMKVYRGKWWVKDSSAIHFVPTVTITKLPDIPVNCNENTIASSQEPMRLEIRISNPRDFPVNISLRRVVMSQQDKQMDKNAPHAPFFIPFFFLDTFPIDSNNSNSSVASDDNNNENNNMIQSDPSLDILLGAYEDELLRDEEEEEVNENILIQSAYEEQIKSSGSQVPIWLTYSKYNYALVSIPMKSELLQHSLNEVESVIYQLPLSFSFSSNNTDKHTGEDTDHLVQMRIVFPNSDS